MKNLKTILWAVTIMLFALVTMPTNSYSLGANFVAASNTDYFSTGIGVINTGNDVKGNPAMHVWVCDGSSPTFAWDDFNGNPGSAAIHYTDASDPDVSLVYDGTVWWAIIVYYTSSSPFSGDYVMETWKWNSGTLTYNYQTTISLQNVAQGYTINIDADINNYFVVVWDDGSTYINAWRGSTNASGPHLTGGSYQTIYSEGEIMPDVSLYAGEYSTSFPDVYFTYINTGNNTVRVDFAPFNNLTSASSNNRFASIPLTSPINPRIGCPPYTSGNTDFWTVVYNDGNAIIGKTHNHFPNTYTNLCFTDISSEGNVLPAISYSNDYDASNTQGGILVGWTFYNLSQITAYPPGATIIAVQCDYTGAVVAGCNYMWVPYTINQYNSDVQDAISLSGRDYYTTNIFYTWYDDPNTTISYKEDLYTNTSLRLINDNQNSKPICGIYPNPNSGNFQITFDSEKGEAITIEIYNSIGEKVYTSIEVPSSTSIAKEISLTDFNSGIYLVRIIEKENMDNLKFVLTK